MANIRYPEDVFQMAMNEIWQMGPPPAPRTREEELEAALREASASLQEYKSFVEKLKQEPNVVGTVVGVTDPGRGIVSSRGAQLEVNLPEGATTGSQVRLLMSTNQPTSVFAKPVALGDVVTVDRFDGESVHFSAGASTKIAAVPESFAEKPAAGDRVQLDPSGMVVLKNLGRDVDRFAVSVDRVAWEDVGGLEDAKEALREAIEFPRLHAELYASYGQRPSKGCLLYGPPGCGKTLLGKAAATSLGDSSGFIYVKGAEVLSKWVGESEATVRSIFDRARDFKRRTGNSAVVFIDEAEALLGVRGGSGLSVNSMTVPSFLAEMDGLEDSGAFVMLSTNRPDTLDPAIVRDGRIDRRIKVGRPDKRSAADVFGIAMRGRPCGVVDALVEHAVEMMFSDKLALYELLFDDAPRELLCLRDMLSGAVIAGFVHRAADIAIRRERGGERRGERGITTEDVTQAIRESFREMADVHNVGAISEKIENVGKFPTNVRKAVFYAGTEEAHFGPAVEFGSGHVQAARGGALN